MIHEATEKRFDLPHNDSEVNLRRSMRFIEKAFEDQLDVDVYKT